MSQQDQDLADQDLTAQGLAVQDSADQELVDQEVQNIFLNPRQETEEEGRVTENRPSAPGPITSTCTTSSSYSEELITNLTTIFHTTPTNLTLSESGLDFAGPQPSGSGTLPLSQSTPLEGKIVPAAAAAAEFSPIQHLLVRDTNMPGPSPIQELRHLQTREVTGAPAAARYQEISPIIERLYLCKPCKNLLLHGGYPKSYFIKKFLDQCTLCEYKCSMKDYQKICLECSRRRNLCIKCTASPVVSSAVFNFDKLLEGEGGEVFARLAEMIQHKIVYKVYRAYDVASTLSDSEKNAETCFRYLIQKYK